MKLIGIVKGEQGFAHESNRLVEMTPAEYRSFLDLRNAVVRDKSLLMSADIDQDLSAEIAAIQAWTIARFRLNALKDTIKSLEQALGVQKSEGDKCQTTT